MRDASTRQVWLSLVMALLAIALMACDGGKDQPTIGEMPAVDVGAEVEPKDGCGIDGPRDGIYFGVNLDWSNDTIEDYSTRLGNTPAVFVLFAAFPMDESTRDYVEVVASQVAASDSSLMLTLEPTSGLASVTRESADALAQYLGEINASGTPVFLRFAHEMNGSWYAWSQAPTEYIAAFRAVAAAVHAKAPTTAMVWAPNSGGGYPFTGGEYAAAPGTPAYSLLDTNGDGTLSMLDDPYAPYYPGDDAVDWVGMSLYHWGSAYPWGENELPEPNKFIQQLTGQYQGANGDELSLPDFYNDYGVTHDKPVAITETAAFYRPSGGGAAADQIKRMWWSQVFLEDLPETYGQVKMINWFEWSKYEAEVGDNVDWTVTRDPALLENFLSTLPDYLRFAGDGC